MKVFDLNRAITNYLPNHERKEFLPDELIG